MQLIGFKLEKIISKPSKYVPQSCLLTGIFTKNHHKWLVLNDKNFSFVTNKHIFFSCKICVGKKAANRPTLYLPTMLLVKIEMSLSYLIKSTFLNEE